jgi:glycosyltransferase involved in cell wall biosynthesis
VDVDVLTRARRVSVVVPTRNRPGTLRQALASIRALEAADLTFEILVGDNGDDPETPTVCAEFNARHLPVSEEGAGAARNAGLAAATGELIAFLDDDDVWMSNHVRPHLAVFDARPEIEAVMARVMAVDNDLREIAGPWPWTVCAEGDEAVRTMLSGYYPQIGATIVRAGVREAVGAFDVSLLGDQDWDWQIRIARRRKTAFIADSCVLFRQRPPGSFDALRFRRLGFGRRVFLRHAIPERRVWPNLRAMSNSYRDVLWHYYEYFTEAAVERGESGDRKGVWRAIWGAWRTFPLRASFHLVAPKPLRRALLASLTPGRRNPVANGAR